MRYSSRFFLYAPFAGLLLLTAIACTHWWLVASALAKHLDAVNGREIMPGVRFAFAQKRLAGFPFRADVMLKGLRVTVEDVSGPLTWSSEDFAAHALTYGREQIIFEAAGRQALSWTDAQGAAHRFVFLPGTFRAGAIVQKGQLIRFDAEIADLDGKEFRAANAQLHFRALRSRSDLYLRLDGAHIGGGYAASLGPDVSSLVADTSIVRPALLTAMLRGEEAPGPALENWRDDGGRLAVHDLSLSRAGHLAHYRGMLSLDEAHDLAGMLSGGGKSQLRFSGNRMMPVSALVRR